MKIEKISDKIMYNDESLTKKIIYKEDKILNFVLNFRPGQGVPPHNHKITQGDVIHCKGVEVFSIKNTGNDDMSLFVVLAPNPSAVYSKGI